MSSPLALLGGVPAVTEPAPHFTWPPFAGCSSQSVLHQVHGASSCAGTPDVVAQLEDTLAAYVGVRHAVATNSGTAALHAVYLASGIRPRDEVIVPAYTSFATVTPLLHLGAVPVLADSEETGNISIAEVAARITPNTKAIVVTHLWGIPAGVAALRRLADFHGLLLIEDASHAHGATVGGRKVGSIGDAAVFSLSTPKPLSADEGGLVLTNDDDLYHRLLAHGYGGTHGLEEVPTTHPLRPYAAASRGSASRLHPVAAAAALAQVPQLDGYLDGRADVAEYLCDELRHVPGVMVPILDDDIRAAWYRMPLTYLPDELDGLPVERLAEALQAEGLHELQRPHSPCPLNLLPLLQDPAPLFPDHPQLDRIAYRPGQCPMAERVHRSTLTLPVWHNEEDVPLVRQYIAGFRKVAEHHHALH
ncbi:DegT/DnrJ/EryC1/StrS aminotransferase family protein [Amycolatopsis sp. H20-H5]|uniref:DegT/DnrJ/EryC1/StrS aminotransferase family protein n=1 Tax=Amycolatopsis sp. H20-H5 TaxID=3046309 RepID=UPI002DBE766C|nr:DegT/DnrJ/EryC1/StrS family aminotransferase [Amycolatopsis sp. H20-H5]MEC3974298.1 DegT/DnrJ/EryC1/StrS family aminotransferase [Amycolatopsis sp. H20-H5]